MVLTQPRQPAWKVRKFWDVSIPLWFLRNITLKSKPFLTPLKGFHTTMVLTQHTSWAIRITGRLYVSIPLWFSRNKSKRQNCRKCFVSFHTTMVLTQRTTMKLCRRSQTSRFHTTMVLTQQLMALLNYRTSIAFPYHYGSHATLVMRIVIERPSEFPYHYGSHATLFLWFSEEG